MSRITNDADTIQQAIGFPLVGVVQGSLLIVWIAYNMLTESSGLRRRQPFHRADHVRRDRRGSRTGPQGLSEGPDPGRRRQRELAGEPLGGARSAGVQPRGAEHPDFHRIERRLARRQHSRRGLHQRARSRRSKRSATSRSPWWPASARSCCSKASTWPVRRCRSV